MDQSNPSPLPIRASLRTRASSPTPGSPSIKRRRMNKGTPTYFDPTALHEFVERQKIDTDSSAEDLYRFATDIKRVISDAVALTRASEVKIKKIPTSTLDMSDVMHHLNVQYKSSLPASRWVISPASYRPPGTPWLETVLEAITNDDCWGIESCEAFVRTVIDLIIFDRLKLLDRGSPCKAFRIVGEYQIETRTTDPAVVFSGRCDYVIGYGGSPGRKDLESAMVAIEVKRRYTLCANSPQLIGYLVGLQQQRQAAKKLISFVYGIATDGVNFLFHRLDESLALQTKFVEGSDRALIYKYIDIILESALRSTPHTTPSEKFARDPKQFHTAVELPLWNHRVDEARKIIVQTEEDMEWVIRPDETGRARLVFVGCDDAGVSGGEKEEEEEEEEYEDELVDLGDARL